MEPPAGLVARPLAMPDARRVYEVVAAEEEAVLGRAEIEEADIVAEWQQPSHDLAARSIGLLDRDLLVGFAELGYPGRYDASVDPSYHGRGIGTWLAGWAQDRARAEGQREIGMPVPLGSPGERLLTALGYHERWTSWLLHLPPGRDFAPAPLPDGYTVREALSDEDRRAAWDVIEQAFGDWSGRAQQQYDDWAAVVLQRPGFQPWNLRVAVSPGGEVVGGVQVYLVEDDIGFVARLGVRRDQRGRGLGRAALVEAFDVAARHGATQFELTTDSRTGALGLYRSVGMETNGIWVNLGVTLGAAAPVGPGSPPPAQLPSTTG